MSSAENTKKNVPSTVGAVEADTLLTRPSSPSWPNGFISTGPDPSESIDTLVKLRAGGLMKSWGNDMRMESFEHHPIQ